VAAQLQHPNIVTTHDIISTPQASCIVMELVEGQDLQSLLQERGRLGLDETLDILGQVAAALDHAHGSGVIHRDIKPANIMIEPSGQVKVMDFGIAKVEHGGSRTSTGLIMGTPDYMSPEQAKGSKIDARADIFSLGCVLYECVSGTKPFHDDSLTAILLKVVIEPAPPIDFEALGLPRALDGVLRKAMAKESGQRFASPGELMEAARQAARGVEVAPPPVSPTGTLVATPAVGPAGTTVPEPARPGTRSSSASGAISESGAEQRWLFWSLATLAVAVIAGGILGVVALRTPDESPSPSSLATPLPSSEPEAPAAAPETPSSTPTEVNDAATAPEATPAPSPSTHTPAPPSTRRTAPDPDRAVEPPRAALVAVPEEPDTRPAPVPVRAEPVASSSQPMGERAAAEAPGELFVDFEHSLKEGYLRIWVDGVPVLDTDIEGRVKKKIVGIKWRKGHLEQTFAVSPGRHSIQVQVSWGDKQKTETIRGRFESGSQRILEVRLGRIRKNLDLEWR
jgi:serine/threonine-protein kinase